MQRTFSIHHVVLFLYSGVNIIHSCFFSDANVGKYDGASGKTRFQPLKRPAILVLVSRKMPHPSRSPKNQRSRSLRWDKRILELPRRIRQQWNHHVSCATLSQHIDLKISSNWNNSNVVLQSNWASNTFKVSLPIRSISFPGATELA